MAKKKRYHQSAADRLAESRGEERHLYRSFMDEAGRKAERHAYEMIKEDHSAPANLPQKEMIKNWPKYDYVKGEGLQDNIHGIDGQMDDDVRQANRHRSKSKY